MVLFVRASARQISAWGQRATFAGGHSSTALPPEADNLRLYCILSYGPRADISRSPVRTWPTRRSSSRDVAGSSQPAPEPWGVVAAPRGRRFVILGFTIARAAIVEIDVVATPSAFAGSTWQSSTTDESTCVTAPGHDPAAGFGPMTAMSHLGHFRPDQPGLSASRLPLHPEQLTLAVGPHKFYFFERCFACKAVTVEE